VIVGPKNSKTVVVKVKTPYEAEAGVFPIDVVLRDSGGNDKRVTVTTKVTQIFDIDLKCSQVHQVGTPNGFITYPMVVENRGNGHDTISLEVTNLPDGWSHNFKDVMGTQVTSVDLEYGSKVDVKLNIWVSAGQMETAEQVTARAQSVYDPSKQDQIQLTAEIRMPDLKIQSVVYNPSQLRENKVVQIVVLLQNVGTGGATDVVVEFYDNGRYVSQDSISYIRRGVTGKGGAFLTWLRTGVTHNFIYFGDPVSSSRPNGRVLESDETNNVLEMRKPVTGADTIPGASGGMAMLAVLGAVFVAMAFRRRH
jgi:uncharacterized membrane protein